MSTRTPTRNRPNEAKSADLLKLADVLAEIGITRSTFYDWRAKRKAPRCYRLPNGELRVTRAELDRWLESLEESA